MSQEVRQNELQEKTQQLLDGPLKHIRGGGAGGGACCRWRRWWSTPASAQSVLRIGRRLRHRLQRREQQRHPGCGRDRASKASRYSCASCATAPIRLQTETGPGGLYSSSVPGGATTVSVLIPTGTQASPPNVGDDTFDSDGVPDGGGFSVASRSSANGSDDRLRVLHVRGASTGHRHAGLLEEPLRTRGRLAASRSAASTYTKAQAIAWLGKVGKDKTTTMFSSLVPAMLNILIGNDGSCVSGTIAAANTWMTAAPGRQQRRRRRAPAWVAGEPLHITMDNYNNGLLCAPHRQ